MIVVFLLELVALFFLSKKLTSELSYLTYSVFRSRRIAVFLIAVIFFLGTLIHELSHAIMAKALFVHVGKMELFPELNGDSLKLGSVEVGKTDPFRNFLIGVAPFIAGTGLLLIVLYYAFSNNYMGFNLFTIVVFLFTFIVSNTMYSSKKDMEGTLEFLILVITPIFVLYFLGVRIPGFSLETFTHNQFDNYFEMASIFLGVPIVLDIGFIVIARIIRR